MAKQNITVEAVTAELSRRLGSRVSDLGWKVTETGGFFFLNTGTATREERKRCRELEDSGDLYTPFIDENGCRVYPVL